MAHAFQAATRLRKIVGSELKAIDDSEGEIPAAAIVQRAATPGTALNEWDNKYHYFEWNDTVAADEYRQEQARALIRAIEIRVTSGDQTLSTRGFYAVGDANGKVYRPVERIVGTELNRQIIDRFQNRLDSHR